MWPTPNYGTVSSRFLTQGVQVLLEVSERPCCSYRSIRERNGNCPFAVFAGGSQDKESALLGEGRENIPPTSQSTAKKRRKLFQKPSSVASLTVS